MLIKSTGQTHPVTSVGVFNPKHTETDILEAGEVGFVIAGIKDILVRQWVIPSRLPTPDVAILPGFKKVKPQVYAGLFPIDAPVILNHSAKRYKNYKSMIRLYSLSQKALML